MAKASKKQKSRKFEKEYNKVMKDFKDTALLQGNQKQWSAPGDFFIKFSMYKETSSGTTSSNTSFVTK